MPINYDKIKNDLKEKKEMTNDKYPGYKIIVAAPIDEIKKAKNIINK